MRFGFTSDQRELAGAVRDILDGELTPAARSSAPEASGRRGSGWKSLAEAGVFGLLVPEEAGGLGLNELDAILVLEELGRAAVPGPVAETAFVAAPLLVGTEWSQDLAEGAVAGVAAEAGSYLPDADVADVLILLDGDSASLQPSTEL